jgi:hypothetical protein
VGSFVFKSFSSLLSWVTRGREGFVRGRGCVRVGVVRVENRKLRLWIGLFLASF